MGERIAAAMRRPAILAAVWICALILLAGTLTRMRGQWRGRDFSDKYESAWALRHRIDPYPIDLTEFASQLGMETGGLIHASDTPTFLLCFEAAHLPAAAARLLDVDGDQCLRAGNRDVSVARASTRTLRAHGVAAGGTHPDVGAAQSEFLLGTIATDHIDAARGRDARDGTRARRHGRPADRSGGVVARISDSACGLFHAPTKMARSCVRARRNRGWTAGDGGDAGTRADPQLRSRRGVGRRILDDEPVRQS